MSDPEIAVEQVRTWWTGYIGGDLDAAEATLADDVVRIGPWDGVESEIVRGRAAYRRLWEASKINNPHHRSTINELVASSDGRHVYLNVTEWIATMPNAEEHDPIRCVLICDVNDDNLIQKVDVFWKQSPKLTFADMGYEARAKAARVER